MNHLKQYWKYHLVFWIMLYIQFVFLRNLNYWFGNGIPFDGASIGNLHLYLFVVLIDAMFVYILYFTILPSAKKKKWIWVGLIYIINLVVAVVIKPHLIHLINTEILLNYLGRVGPYIFNSALFFGMYGVVENIETQKKNRALEKLNHETALAVLYQQTQPHFMMNTLNNIYSFLQDSSPEAGEMIMRLSALLKYSYSKSSSDKVPILEEIDYLKNYIELEKIRLNEAVIEFNESIQNTQLLIAPMLLITFVENAFKHGLSEMTAHPKLSIDISTQSNQLFFRIQNTKPASSPIKTTGTGLVLVQDRLDLIYPDKHELIVDTKDELHTVFLKIAL